MASLSGEALPASILVVQPLSHVKRPELCGCLARTGHVTKISQHIIKVYESVIGDVATYRVTISYYLTDRVIYMIWMGF